ncbi:MAG: AgmX/PglI C-terminal domain-containing protein [Gammaproteobacteria bacterium]|nr:AgmX/PglI C-terminal domain-containing protein [Gammaproteobacteria bacterium]
MSDRDMLGENNSEADTSDERLTGEQLVEEREALTSEHQAAQRKLDDLEAAVCAAEDELVAHLATRPNYDLLEQTCQTLETLAQYGVAELFWGKEMVGATADQHLADVLAKVDWFYVELKRLEDNLQSALAHIEGQRQVLDVLDYDIYQALNREESRKREWIIERDATKLRGLRLAMPWMRGFEEDKLFRKTLAGAMLTGVLLGLLIPLIDLPIPEHDELTKIPERFAKLIRKEPKALPPPQPVREKRAEEPIEQSDPEQPVELPPEPAIAVEAEPESTREKINSVGILAFRENFSNLRESRPSTRLGSMARVTDAGESAVGRPERAMVTAQGTGSSGGINLAAISRDINGGGVELVEGVRLSQVASSIDGGGSGDRPRSAGATAGRTDEEIQIVFDRYKAALYRLYNRELRKDPTLRGQMVLRLTIEPDGSVSLCGLQSSDMKAPNLAHGVVASVSGFQFGAKDVPAVTILYPIDFLPTA